MIGFKQWNIYVVPGTVKGVPNRTFAFKDLVEIT